MRRDAGSCDELRPGDAADTSPRGSDEAAVRFVFLLAPGFSHLALAGAVEPLRQANRALGAELFRWRAISPDATPVAAGDGLAIAVSGGAGPLARDEMLFVLGGADLPRPERDRLAGYLRRESVRGIRVGGICGGVRLLARAGLLDGAECAAHWEEVDALAETFPRVRFRAAAFTAGRRPTAPAGGAAEMMLHLVTAALVARIGGQEATATVARVADLMLMQGVRGPGAAQRISVQSRFGMRNPRLARVIRLMEETLDEPLSALEIAEAANMSVRQTERLFSRYVQMTPMAYYTRLRLEKARDLLLRTEMSVTEVAVACGFQSSSHFAKRYRTRFGVNPRGMRAISAAPPPADPLAVAGAAAMAAE